MEAEPIDLAAAVVPAADGRTWILVEDEGAPNCYTVISYENVIGEIDLENNTLRYTIDGIERNAVAHVISEDLNFVENELNLMAMEFTNHEYPEFWALVNQGCYPDKVQIVMVGCKKVGPETGHGNQMGFLLSLGQQANQEPFQILCIHKSEQDLQEELHFVKHDVMDATMCVEKDNEVEAAGLENAYFLVQYNKNALTLIYTIVSYQETVWKEGNEFPSVVTYIGNDCTTHQCVILRKSFDRDELTQLLELVWNMCNSTRCELFDLDTELMAQAGDMTDEG